MRVLSAQGKEVWEILQRDKVYHASPKLCREANDYSKDVERLGGYQPIWGFAWPEINFYSMYNGAVLEYLRCEMSLDQHNCWDNYVLFELEIRQEDMLIGYAHNACAYSRIFKEINFDMVKAVYTLRDSDEDGFYYKVLSPIYTDGKDIITTVGLDCRAITEWADHSAAGLEYGNAGKCLLCERDTSFTYKNKHFCCIGHGWQHEQRFKRICRQHNIPEELIAPEYDKLTDTDFSRGHVKAVKSLRERLL